MLRALEGPAKSGRGVCSFPPQQAGDWAQRQTGEGHKLDQPILGTVFLSFLSSLSLEESCVCMFQSGLSQARGIMTTPLGLPLGQRRRGNPVPPPSPHPGTWVTVAAGIPSKVKYLRATFGGEASFCCTPPQLLISENPDGGMVDCLAGLQ